MDVRTAIATKRAVRRFEDRAVEPEALAEILWAGHRSGSSSMRAVALQNAAIMFAMGLFLPGIDNWAHAGGFGGGWLVSRWLDPLTRERIDHLIAGLACIALTALAVVASLIFGFQALRQ